MCYSHPRDERSAFQDMLALVYSSTPPRSVEESSFRSGNNGEHQRPALDVAVNVACSASAGSLRFLKCYSHRFNKSQFSLIVAVSSPTEIFFFAYCTVFQRALAWWLVSNLKLARLRCLTDYRVVLLVGGGGPSRFSQDCNIPTQPTCQASPSPKRELCLT